MTSENSSFGAEEVIQLTSHLEADDATFVIGGQATNLWAFFYRKENEILQLEGPFTSEDIDYFGSQEAARTLAKAIRGKLLLPEGMDNHTPNTAQVIASINGKPLVIDFLGSVLGVQTRELKRGVSSIKVTALIGGKHSVVTIKVLHPVICLKSRILNIVSLERKGGIAQRQLLAAVAIVKCYINESLAAGDWKEARDCFAQLLWYLKSDAKIKGADLSTGVDVLDIFRAFEEDNRIDVRFRKHQLKAAIRLIEQKRKSRR